MFPQEFSVNLFPSLINVEGPRDFASVVKRESVFEAEKENEEGKPRRHLEDLRKTICEIKFKNYFILRHYKTHQELCHEFVHFDVHLVEPQRSGRYLKVIPNIDCLHEKETSTKILVK